MVGFVGLCGVGYEEIVRVLYGLGDYFGDVVLVEIGMLDFCLFKIVFDFGIGFVVCDWIEEFVVLLFIIRENMFFNLEVIGRGLFLILLLNVEMKMVEEIGWFVVFSFND